MNTLKKEREKIEHESQKSLDKFSVSLIKLIGIFGTILGFIILAVFWFWILRKLF